MTIRLQQVIQAIEEADDVFTSFWDTKTGETVYLADSLMTGEMDETFAAEIENAPERYLRFPSKHEIHQSPRQKLKKLADSVASDKKDIDYQIQRFSYL